MLVPVDEIEEFQSRPILQRRLTMSIQLSNLYIGVWTFQKFYASFHELIVMQTTRQPSEHGLYLGKFIASAGNFPHGWDTSQGPVSRKSRNFSSDIILFASWKRKRSKTRNFAVILIFLPFTSCEKTSFTEQAGRSFTDGFSDPKSFRDFREKGPRSFSVYTAPRRTSRMCKRGSAGIIFFLSPVNCKSLKKGLFAFLSCFLSRIFL